MRWGLPSNPDPMETSGRSISPGKFRGISRQLAAESLKLTYRWIWSSTARLSYLQTLIWDGAESDFLSLGKVGDQTPSGLPSDAQKTYRCRCGVLACPSLANRPFLGRASATSLVCDARTSVCVKDTGSSVKLIYDVDDWQNSTCCCLHLAGPVACCSFGELQQVINDLPLTN